ncbi:hypothetical protein F7018_16435 [Tenacibaculum aiptasiae]|uniref:GNAT family N-acetyltransferase n=1 Tax=Tenacibaculum aiptasiae TaxID=426481 RepID=A0A7J5A7U8_9FLAO|nr:hypothetical protein [Tenacibaculum aiptasiae]KAB1153652.1 hypothetical protein F7018_16435 [Tenacibaculum aiptasiae]
MILTKNYLERLTTNEVYNLSKFVVEENFNHHSVNDDLENIKKDILSVYNEELKYGQNSKIFVSKDDYGNISGSIRVLKWNYLDKLPIETLFGINPLMYIEDRPFNEIWHIGRFAIKKGINDSNLFKKLMVCAIAPICNNIENIAFAECDNKLLRIMSLLGIKAEVVGRPINYLGSETIPVSFSHAGLIDFYNKNKHLVLNQSLLDGKGVIENYTFV